MAVSLTSSPLYCFRQCKKRQVFASQKETVSKSSPRFWWEDEGGQTGVSEGGDGPSEHPSDTNLQDLLNAVDGGSEQGADLLVVIDVVRVSQTHEQDVGRQTWDQIDGYTSRLQLWRDTNRKRSATERGEADSNVYQDALNHDY